jgi:hypothetical protein
MRSSLDDVQRRSRLDLHICISLGATCRETDGPSVALCFVGATQAILDDAFELMKSYPSSFFAQPDVRLIGKVKHRKMGIYFESTFSHNCRLRKRESNGGMFSWRSLLPFFCRL